MNEEVEEVVETAEEINDISETSAEEENGSADQSPEESGPSSSVIGNLEKSNKSWRICFSILAALLIVTALLFGAFFFLTRDITVNLNDTPKIFALENPLLSKITVSDIDPETIDTSEPGFTQVPITFCGFLTRSVTVEAKDLEGPVLTVRRIVAAEGAELSAEDFILACEDRLDVEYLPMQLLEPDATGMTAVRISAVDANGNRSEMITGLTVLDEKTHPSVELGCSKSDAVEALKEAYPKCTEFSYGQINMLKAGCYSVDGYAGKTLYRVFLDVLDTTPPAGNTVELNVRLGDDLKPEDFVESISDYSSVAVSFVSEPDTRTAGLQCVGIRLTDEAGNVSELEAKLHVWILPEILACEYGEEPDWLSKQLKLYAAVSNAQSPLALKEELDCSKLKPGCYPITLTGEGTDMELFLVVDGSNYPEGRALSRDMILGEPYTADEFASYPNDDGSIECSFDTEPDFNSNKAQRVTVVLSDPYGNSRKLSGRLKLWNIPQSVQVTCGTDNEKLASMLFGKLEDDEKLEFGQDFDCAALDPGIHEIPLQGYYGDITVEVDVVDNEPPSVEAQSLTICLGQDIKPEDFIVSVTDRSPTETEFVTVPDNTTVHTETVYLRTTDSYRNAVLFKAELKVIEDTVPPQIGGVETIYATAGDTISYRTNVWAVDNVDGTVTVSVDASAVDAKTPGVYQVEYSAKDKAGNCSTVLAEVIVQPTNEQMVAQMADEVLASILYDGMTDWQKAYAVYCWCCNNISYSSSTANLIEQYVNAAYTGLSYRYGNCYVYYAVASTLLTDCGIENIKVQRVPGYSSPHYWNLVKIDGAWYHMDTCPHYRDYPLDSFLLTDRDLEEYTMYCVAGYYDFDHNLYPATP